MCTRSRGLFFHQKHVAQETFHTKGLLHQKSFAPQVGYARRTLHQKPWHHKGFTLPRLAFKHQKPKPFTPPIHTNTFGPETKTVYTTNTFTPETFTPHIFHNATLHPKAQEDYAQSTPSRHVVQNTRIHWSSPTVREASPHTTPATKSKSPTLPNRKPYWESAEYHSTMIRAWTPNVPLKVKLQHRQILHLLQKVALCRHQISVTLSFCYFFFLWHVLSNWHEIFVIRRLLHQASSSNSWGACFFFVGKKHLFGDFTHPLRPWCLLSGLVKTSDFQPWGHTNVTRFSESRLWQLGTQRIPSRDPWILKCIFTYTTLLRHTSSNASNQWWGV